MMLTKYEIQLQVELVKRIKKKFKNKQLVIEKWMEFGNLIRYMQLYPFLERLRIFYRACSKLEIEVW